MAEGLGPPQPGVGASSDEPGCAPVVVDQAGCYAAGMALAFDGICVLCNGFVRFLVRHDRSERLRFARSTSAGGAAIFAAAGQNSDNPVSVVLADGDDR